LKILGRIVIDNNILSIIAGYIATGMELLGLEKTKIELDRDTIILGIRGKNITITIYSQEKPEDNGIFIVLNQKIKDFYVHTMESPGHKRQEWITDKPVDIHCFTGAFMGFYLKTSDPIAAMEEAVDIVKSMKNDNPVSQLWEMLSYYKKYKRLLESVERLLSRRDLLEKIALDKSLNILIGFKNIDSSLTSSQIILWGKNIFSTQPVRRVRLAEKLPSFSNSDSFICIDISSIKTCMDEFSCNERYCCIYGDDPVRLIVRLEKILSVKNTE